MAPTWSALLVLGFWLVLVVAACGVLTAVLFVVGALHVAGREADAERERWEEARLGD